MSDVVVDLGEGRTRRRVGGYSPFGTAVLASPSDVAAGGGTAGIVATSGGPPPDPDEDALPVPGNAVAATPATLANLISSNPSGTNFSLAAGTYQGSFPNKGGNGYYGNPSNPLAVRFHGGTTYSNTVENEGSAATSGTLTAFTLMGGCTWAHMSFQRYRGHNNERGHSPFGGAANTIRIDNIHSFENQYSGLRFIGQNWLVTRLESYHNGQYGASGGGINNTLRGYLFYENGVEGPSWGIPRWHISDRGGSKFTVSRGFTATNGEVRDHPDMGLWFDIANRDTLIDGLWTHHNEKHGVIYEANHGPATIKNVVAEDNATKNTGISHRHAQIFVAMTPDVTIEDSIARRGRAGITGYQWNHPQWAQGNCGRLENLLVRNCVIGPNIGFATAGVASLTSLNGQHATSSQANNRWQNNTYLDTSSFYWGNNTGGDISYAQWQAMGMT